MEITEEFKRHVAANIYDEDMYLTLLNSIVEKELLSDYVETIKIVEQPKINPKYAELSNKNKIVSSAIYNRQDGIIIIKSREADEDIDLYYYQSLIDFSHELQHADQTRLLKNFDKNFDMLCKLKNYTLEELKELNRVLTISSSIAVAAKNIELYYSKYHNLFPFEHEANYYGFVNAEKYLGQIYSKKELSTSTEVIKRKLLLSGYAYKGPFNRVVSPAEQIIFDKIGDRQKRILKQKRNLGPEERMILGLPITKEECNKVLRIKQG